MGASRCSWCELLTSDQAAAALGISPSTADRWWVYARAWLGRAIAQS